MSDAKLFAGHAVRRLRRASGLTQAEMAQSLSVSPSYLNLIERNQRPLTGTVIVRLAERFDFDPRSLSGVGPGGGMEAIRKRLADPLFTDLPLDRAMIDDWVMAFPDAAEAFARAFDKSGGITRATSGEPEVLAAVRREIERWRNHFGDLDALAETMAEELRQGSADLYAAIGDRLRIQHSLSIRVLPVDILPAHLRRLDLHARQLQLSELLDSASRTFAAAFQLGQLEAKDEIEALVRGADFAERASERLYRRHLTSYFAAALMMPYSRFIRACQSTGYDLSLLQRRFGAGFEMVAHRLTTLQRVGARGLPFFMIRIDRAGHASKRFAGASNASLVASDTRCPLWQVHAAFEAGGRIVRQWVELEDGARWFTLARTVRPQGAQAGRVSAEFVIGLGVEARHAESLTLARGTAEIGATPIGLGCAQCLRPDCPQRGLPPAHRVLVFNERERGVSPFGFAGE